jgi:hypothetical protein
MPGALFGVSITRRKATIPHISRRIKPYSCYNSGPSGPLDYITIEKSTIFVG